jgi:hypothetical protein
MLMTLVGLTHATDGDFFRKPPVFSIEGRGRIDRKFNTASS